MRYLRPCLLLFLCTSPLAAGQFLELSGGNAHISGAGGLDGSNVGVSLWFTHRISLGFDYDDTYDISYSVFELTQTGTIVTKSHPPNFLVGRGSISTA